MAKSESKLDLTQDELAILSTAKETVPIVLVFIVITIFLLGLAVRFIMAMIPETDLEEVVENPDLFGARVQRIMKDADRALGSSSLYYRSLSVEGKTKFKQRLRYVIATKRFFAQRGKRITHEQVLMTAAAFVQLTFGLADWQLPYIRNFILYEDLVSERFLKRDYRGLTGRSGWVRLSWRYLKNGFDQPTDGINLALHELAHGIEVSIQEEQIVAERIATSFEKFASHFEVIKQDPLRDRLALFSQRDLNVRSEFFASAVEVFFEQPSALREHHPELFDLLCYCFHQDPSRSEDDFQLEPDHTALLERQFASSERKAYLHPLKALKLQSVIQFFLVTGLFVGAPMTVVYALDLLHPISALSSLFLASLILGLMLFKRSIFDSGHTSITSFILFLLVGWLPVSSAFGLVLNETIILVETEDSYPISRAHYVQEVRGIVMELDGDNKGLFVRQRSIPSEWVPYYKAHRDEALHLVVYRSTGLGMDVFDGVGLALGAEDF